MPDRPASTTTRRHGIGPRHLIAVALIIVGIALLIVAAKAIDLGLATTVGPSWPQVIAGWAGTLLAATGLACLVQPFPTTPPRDEDR
ncbi:MAG TPA: hypothetical protein VGT61_12195 [Thermomicrobiales bacterium]|nr:hypothetical protein [Thermomicrobiales bacterium]